MLTVCSDTCQNIKQHTPYFSNITAHTTVSSPVLTQWSWKCPVWSAVDPNLNRGCKRAGTFIRRLALYQCVTST